MTNTDQLLVDVLRAAGHEDAADLAQKLMTRSEPDEELNAGAPTSATQTHDNGRPSRQATTGAAAIAGRQAA